MNINLKLIALIIVIVLIGIGASACEANAEKENDYKDETSLYTGLFPSHVPYGEARGINPGRVVWVYDAKAVDWNGQGYWWNPSNFDASAIFKMIEDGIADLAGTETASEGWKSLFENHNETFGKDTGYTPGEKIAIKVNLNGSGVNDDDTSGETALAYTNPVLLKELLNSLVSTGGVKAEDIIVYDVSRIFPDYMVSLCTEGNLSGVSFVGRNNAQPDLNEPITWSNDFETVTTYLPTCLTQSTYLINLADLKGHSYGITLTGKNLFGSFLNSSSMRPPQEANLHQFLTDAKMGSYSPITDLMAHEQIYSKTFLYMFDALICAPSEGKEITVENSKWTMTPFNGDYTSSIFFSQDAVAIDSVGADFLTNEATVLENNSITAENQASENYLHEAALLSETPSGTDYQNAKQRGLKSLGAHEHWNNVEDKQYSRNLNNGEGIELILLDLTNKK